MIAGKSRSLSGFTLIELMVTIAVAVILATIAVPGFQSLVATNRQAADFNEILAGLHYARSEAVKRRQEVSAVITDNGGWRLEVQRNGDVLREMEARDYRTAVSVNEIIFNSLGRRAGCVLDGDDECVVTIDDGSYEIVIHLSGRIEKRSASL